ncbi:Xaa-Pro dipeptidyl-peptidase [Floricoccus penangensis]|uniref:Xaa-Pro dipeptidyl-peptidase n=1 Tax=Floricoccus penangensis TaxID=1859475 RepID=UPI00203D494E|nr:Xaa-Pro dipeptidyl-peptidase [Floricoccus penangensis]URZ87032.1 Xaa-Pro dipeptidyl-peptidase [Floricoccus penangensis]
MKFNQFSIVKKEKSEQLDELKNLGFSVDKDLTEKEILNNFLVNIPFDLSTLQATDSLDYFEFIQSYEDLTWDIFYTLALQLLGFTAHFDFQINDALKFINEVNLPIFEEDSSVNKDNVWQALYLLLVTRTKSGVILIEKLVSEDFLPMDNSYHFFNDKSLATFDTRNLIREVVYVESPVDTDNNMEYDLIKVQIIRPKFDGKLPSVMTASPYHLGINIKANDDQLHDMNVELSKKESHEIKVTDEISEFPKLPEKAILIPESDETEKFTHGWTYTLNDYMLARGFASIYVAGVGTRGSDGFMTSGDYQQVASVTAVIDWLNGRAKAFTDRKRTSRVVANWSNGKVAMTGKSYLGTLAYGAATTGVDGLEVIVAEAGITSWYDYYRENGAISSPGGYPGEDLDVLAALTYSKNLDAADYLKNNDFYQKELAQMTSDIDRTTGDYNQYWHDRNYRPHINKVKADIIAVHGLQDWNVKPIHAFEYLKDLPENVTKHAFLHHGEHIYINNWQSLDFSETINTYFTAKLLDRKLNLELPGVVWQENNVEQSFKSLDRFGEKDATSFKLGSEISNFENQYEQEKYDSYSKNYRTFITDLYTDKANASVIDIKIDDDILINGQIQLNLKVKLNDSKGLLSAQVLEYGDKKRLNTLATMLEPKEIDLGHNFQFDDLKELKLADSPYKLVSKALLNLQNRNGLLQVDEVPADTWMDVKLDLQPTIYQLKKGDSLRVIIYSTDFELTVRDNRSVTYEIDLSQSTITLPHN